MARKGLVNERSLVELLEIANTKEEPRIEDVATDSPYQRDVLSFVLAFRLTNGPHYVKTRLLYKLYRTWAEEPVISIIFTKSLTNIFESKSISGNTHVKINEAGIDISLKLYEKFKDKKDYMMLSPKIRTKLERFFGERKIKPGKNWIPAYALYHIYDKWCYDTRKKSQLSEITFKRICMTYFKHNKCTVKEGIYYKLDESIYEYLSEETLNNLSTARKKQHGSKKEKKEQKKSDEIPSIRSSSESED